MTPRFRGMLLMVLAALVTDADTFASVIKSRPLNPRALAEGSGFERIDAAQAGLDFVHRWIPPHRHPALRHILLSTSHAGGGVCIGDVDADGLPDVFLTRPYGGNRLYRNLGDFRFEDVTAQAGLQEPAGKETWGTGGVFVDIDNDDDLDLHVCAYDGPNRLYVNRGDGTFDERARAFGLDFSGASITMAFADVDRDGDLDAYLLTNRIVSGAWKLLHVGFRDGRPAMSPEHIESAKLLIHPDGRAEVMRAGQRDRLYRNDAGRFTDITDEALGSEAAQRNHFGLSATWWDYDGDGWPDLYVANDFWGDDHLYRNNGDGTFTDVAAEALPHTPWFSMGSDAGDLNNDGRPDFMASDMSGTSHFKQKLGMGDMNAYGWFLERPTPRQYMRNAVYLNTGTRRFMEVAKLAGLADTDWTWSVKIADLDGDGHQDVFVTNGNTRDWMDSDLQQRGTGALIASPPRRESNLAFRNLGDLRFENVSADWGLDHVGVSFGAALGDLDRDGDLDLVVNSFEEPVGLYRNRSTRGHRVLLRLRGTKSNRRGVGAAVHVTGPWGTQLRQLHLARGFASADEDLPHFGLGDVATIEQLTVHWPSGTVQTLASLAADHLYTITEPDDDNGMPATSSAAPTARERTMFDSSDALRGIDHVEAPYDDYARQPLLPQKMSQLGPGLAWGDIDGDGDDDVYVGGAAGRTGMLYVNRGGGRFAWGPIEPFAADAAHEDMAPLFFDADSDGDRDLYVVSGGVECSPESPRLADRLYLNDGTGIFIRAPAGALPDVRDSGGPVAAADFDRDGDLDLFVGGRSIPGQYPLSPRSRLLRNDGGRFTETTEETAPSLGTTGLVTAAAWADFDGDGWLDLLIAHEWGPVKLFLNRTGRLEDATQRAGLAPYLGWWNGLAIGDVDHDGDLDAVAANFGLNSKYHASDEKPALLHHGDFDGSGTMRLVEAEFEDDHLFPVRGKSCSTHAMPHLAEKFSTFRQFALADLQEIYTRQCLAESDRFEANTLASSVLINDGTGRFAVRPLPRLAQASAGFGVVLTEVDGDGHADLYLVQNAYSPQRETGRMDGGVSLLLTGDGTGAFLPVWPDRSGLLVPGDAKGLAHVDLNDDGRADFAVAVNDGPARAFVNRGLGPGRAFKVRLLGPAGNLDAVGARVTFIPGDGPVQTAQTNAGGSYLSQSSPDLFFGLGAGGEVARIDVTWPDGRTTAWSPADDAPRAVIRHPDAAPDRSAKAIVLAKGDALVAAHRELAAALRAGGRFEAALRHLETAQSIQNDDFALYLDRGDTLLASGDAEGAVAPLYRALKLATDPADSGRCRVALGRALWQTGHSDESLDHLSIAVASLPGDADARAAYGDALCGMGRIGEAVEQYGRAVRLQGDRAENVILLANALREEDFVQEAIELYRHLLAVVPDRAEIHYRLGLATEMVDVPGEALAHYERAVALNARHVDALYALGKARRAVGRADEAIRYYRQALTAYPGKRLVRFELAATLKAAGRLDEAIEQLKIILRAAPDDPTTHARLAQLMHASGRRDEALASFRAALRARPDSPTLLNAVAWLLATHPRDDVRDPPEAIRLAERAATLTDHARADVLDTLAAAYASAGRYQDAVRTAKLAEGIADGDERLRRAVLPRIRVHLESYESGQPYREPVDVVR